MRLPSPGFLLKSLADVVKRFPFPMLAAAIAVASFFGLVSSRGEENLYARTWMSSALGIPLFIALAAFAESRGLSAAAKWGLQAVGLLAIVGCWLWLDPNAAGFDSLVLPRYAMLLAVAHLLVAVAPYLNARPVRDFWEYNRQLFANLAVGALFTGVLYAGTSLALLAVDNLFGAHIDGITYLKLLGFWGGIFNTAYFLYHFPKRFESETSSYNWVLHNLCKYILIPIVMLYFVILYAYGGKIAAEWELPHGWVSSLVLGFSVAGIFTYLLNFYLPHEDRSLVVVKFKKWFWWVLLPLTGLLFIAVGKRISDYGVTEERYLVAQLGVWLAVTCAYFFVSKTENIKFIPISLAIVGLSWAFGPLSALSVSKRSQKRVLAELLAKHDRFENGKFKASAAPISDEEQQRVSSCLYFLEKRDALRDMLPEPLDSNLLQHHNLLQWLGLSTFGYSASTQILSISTDNPYRALEVKGFGRAVRAELSPDFQAPTDQNGEFFKLAQNRSSLEWVIVKDGLVTAVEAGSLKPLLSQWAAHLNPGEQYNYVNLSLPERTLDWEHGKARLRLVVESAQVESDSGGLRVVYGNGWVMIDD